MIKYLVTWALYLLGGLIMDYYGVPLLMGIVVIVCFTGGTLLQALWKD